jgi:atypical dual specificity phosphatase
LGRSGYILRRLRARVADRPTGFVWVKAKEVAASGYPSSKQQLEWVKGHGIMRILTLTESPLPSEWTNGLETRHVPMKDHQPPSYEALVEASSYISESVSAREPVLVHCLAGQGRTMCAVAAYLVRSGMDVNEALALLRRLKAGAVERGQEPSLRDFASRSNRGDRSSKPTR